MEIIKNVTITKLDNKK